MCLCVPFDNEVGFLMYFKALLPGRYYEKCNATVSTGFLANTGRKMFPHYGTIGLDVVF